MQFRLCNMMETDCSTYLTRVRAGSPMTQFEQTEAWSRQHDQLRSVLHNLGSRVQYEDSHGSTFPCPATLHGPTSQYYTTTCNVDIFFKIRSSIATYLLISQTRYDPATAFGHTGMFRGAPAVGGPYPGMVPGPQIPAYTV